MHTFPVHRDFIFLFWSLLGGKRERERWRNGVSLCVPESVCFPPCILLFLQSRCCDGSFFLACMRALSVFMCLSICVYLSLCLSIHRYLELFSSIFGPCLLSMSPCLCLSTYVSLSHCTPSLSIIESHMLARARSLFLPPTSLLSP